MEPRLTLIEEHIKILDQKLDKIYKSAEQTRKIMLWTAIITAAVIILPLIGLLFAIPAMLDQVNQISNLGL